MSYVTPLVSVVIPNYNNSMYLSECLKSVLNQTFDLFEIIVVDDCSIDNSVSVISHFLAKDNRIKLIVNGINQGVSASRNIGLKQSVGEFVTTLDSDDCYHINKLEEEVELLKENPEAVGAYTSIEILRGEKVEKINCGDKWSFKKMLLREGNVPRDIMFRRKVITEENIYFDTSLSLYEDWDWKCRLLTGGDIVGSDLAGIVYRKTSRGLSNVNKLNHLFFITLVFSRNFKKISFLKYPFYYLLLIYNLFRSFER